MQLRITTPTTVAATLDDVVSVRAEDPTGAFGILPGHADFLTVLDISVLSWWRADGGEGHCAVHGGVLTVEHGSRISIATRDAVLGDDLAVLEHEILARSRHARDVEHDTRASSRRMQLAAVRHILDYLMPGRRPARWLTPNPGRPS
jgi:F-type H+-transporting ATPase subunit epsilon